MKAKILFLMSSALMALGFSACSGSEDIPEFNKPAGNQTYEVEIGLDLSVSKTRTTLNEQTGTTGTASPWTWDSEGEKLILTDKTGKYLTALEFASYDADDHNKAIFHGVSPDEIIVGDNYLITYPGKGGNTSSNEFTVDLSNADGKIDGLGKSDVMSNIIVFKKHTSSLAGDEHNGKEVYYNESLVTLQKLFTIVHFKMIDQIKDNVIGTALRGEGVHESAKVTIGAIKMNGSNLDMANTLTVEPIALGENESMSLGTESDIYLTMVPGVAVAPIFKRTYGKNGVAYGTPGKTEKLEAGKIYNIGKIGSVDYNGVPVEMKYNSPIVIGTIELTNWGEEQPLGEIIVGGN